MDLYAELVDLIDALNEAKLPYALCGGVAVALHGYPRFTKDIDLLIPDDDLKAVQAVAKVHGFSLESGRIPFGNTEATEREVYRLAKARGEELLTLDLVLVGRVFSAVWETRDLFEWKGRTLSVVSRDGLITMKRLAGRDQDLVDIKRLQEEDGGP